MAEPFDDMNEGDDEYASAGGRGIGGSAPRPRVISERDIDDEDAMSDFDQKIATNFQAIMDRTMDQGEKIRLYKFKEALNLSADDPAWVQIFMLGQDAALMERIPDKLKKVGESLVSEINLSIDRIIFDSAKTEAVQKATDAVATQIISAAEKMSESRNKATISRWIGMGAVGTFLVGMFFTYAGYSLGLAHYRAEYQDQVVRIPALSVIAKTRIGSAWMQFAQQNSPESLTAIMECSQNFGLLSSGRICYGSASKTPHLAWRIRDLSGI